ncbi:unnamed protein product, partial [marine sediment metagenome]
GGGLAMNDGVVSCIGVLRSVLHHLSSAGRPLVEIHTEDLCTRIQRYGQVLGKYLATLTEEERRHFRQLRGIQGQTRRMRQCQKAIRDEMPEFDPDGLDEFLEEEKAQTNERAREIIVRIERTLQEVVIEELKGRYGEDPAEWWTNGVPRAVRVDVSRRYEEDNRKRGNEWSYLHLIQYKKIITQPENWDLFEPILAYGRSGNRDRRTSWLDSLNEQRKVAFHASSGKSISIEDLEKLQELDEWLATQVGQVGTQADEVASERPVPPKNAI